MGQCSAFAASPTWNATEAGCWRQAVRLTRHRPLWSLEHRSQDAGELPGCPLPVSCCRCAAPRAAAPLPAVEPRCCRQAVLQPLMLGAEDGACAPRSMLHCSWERIAVFDQLCDICRPPSSKLTTCCVLLTALTARKAQSITVPAVPPYCSLSTVTIRTCNNRV